MSTAAAAAEIDSLRPWRWGSCAGNATSPYLYGIMVGTRGRRKAEEDPKPQRRSKRGRPESKSEESEEDELESSRRSTRSAQKADSRIRKGHKKGEESEPRRTRASRRRSNDEEKTEESSGDQPSEVEDTKPRSKRSRRGKRDREEAQDDPDDNEVANEDDDSLPETSGDEPPSDTAPQSPQPGESTPVEEASSESKVEESEQAVSGEGRVEETVLQAGAEASSEEPTSTIDAPAEEPVSIAEAESEEPVAEVQSGEPASASQEAQSEEPVRREPEAKTDVSNEAAALLMLSGLVAAATPMEEPKPPVSETEGQPPPREVRLVSNDLVEGDAEDSNDLIEGDAEENKETRAIVEEAQEASPHGHSAAEENGVELKDEVDASDVVAAEQLTTDAAPTSNPPVHSEQMEGIEASETSQKAAIMPADTPSDAKDSAPDEAVDQGPDSKATEDMNVAGPDSIGGDDDRGKSEEDGEKETISPLEQTEGEDCESASGELLHGDEAQDIGEEEIADGSLGEQPVDAKAASLSDDGTRRDRVEHEGIASDQVVADTGTPSMTEVTTDTQPTTEESHAPTKSVDELPPQPLTTEGDQPTVPLDAAVDITDSAGQDVVVLEVERTEQDAIVQSEGPHGGPLADRVPDQTIVDETETQKDDTKPIDMDDEGIVTAVDRTTSAEEVEDSMDIDDNGNLTESVSKPLTMQSSDKEKLASDPVASEDVREQSMHLEPAPHSDDGKSDGIDFDWSSVLDISEERKGCEVSVTEPYDQYFRVHGPDVPRYHESSKPSQWHRLKDALFSAGRSAHPSPGYAERFHSYWKAVSSRIGGNLLDAELQNNQETLDRFLVSRRLRRIHNRLIVGEFGFLSSTSHSFFSHPIQALIKDCNTGAIPAVSLPRDIPGSISSKIEVTRLVSETSTTSGICHHEVVLPPSKRPPCRMHPFPDRLEPQGTPLPGAIFLDPHVRAMSQVAGMKVAENAIWLLVVAAKEYAKNVLRDCLSHMKSVERGKCPPAPRLTSHGAFDRHRTSFSSSFSSENEGMVVLGATDIHHVVATTAFCDVRNIGGGCSRLSFERTLHSSAPSFEDPARLRCISEVSHFLSNDILPVGFVPQRSSSQKESPSPNTEIKKETSVSVENPLPSDVGPPQAPTTASVQSSAAKPTDNEERRSPFGGLGRGAKDLASLKARSSSTRTLSGMSTGGESANQATETGSQPVDGQPAKEASIAATPDANPDPETIEKVIEGDDIPAMPRRGKGFGIKNLAVMLARSGSTRLDDEAEKKPDESKEASDTTLRQVDDAVEKVAPMEGSSDTAPVKKGEANDQIVVVAGEESLPDPKEAAISSETLTTEVKSPEETVVHPEATTESSETNVADQATDESKPAYEPPTESSAVETQPNEVTTEESKQAMSSGESPKGDGTAAEVKT